MEVQLAPPPLAARLLLRLTTPSRFYEEVSADLAEEFALRPSQLWYWRQVIFSIGHWPRPHLDVVSLALSSLLILPAILLDAVWSYCASSVPLKIAATHPPLLLYLPLFIPTLIALAAPRKHSV